ncbi:hypothetical protein [Leptothoe sp. PORK10 BA2]|uniref:hypothetical protein n=1 Tax=Leptothoe sp. PORK10 BA2 TaxID=3110254 RepID=UPI002B211A4C|nr:hypothetical protein [Leptothoe sp. PORK10 BA2]MEA5466770.1 hypothetical protein [Leptothoe sp. PORK10 BA2]
MWRQWQKANNYIRSVQAFQDMSPDLSVRHQVNQSLCRQRRPLSLEAWCEEFQREIPSQRQTLLFIYQCLETYSGIEFNRVRPHDRLVEDLQFPLVCWFDWSTRFCEDVAAQFNIDIGSCFDETRMHTLMDLVAFLEACLASSSNGENP